MKVLDAARQNCAVVMSSTLLAVGLGLLVLLIEPLYSGAQQCDIGVKMMRGEVYNDVKKEYFFECTFTFPGTEPGLLVLYNNSSVPPSSSEHDHSEVVSVRQEKVCSGNDSSLCNCSRMIGRFHHSTTPTTCVQCSMSLVGVLPEEFCIPPETIRPNCSSFPTENDPGVTLSQSSANETIRPNCSSFPTENDPGVTLSQSSANAAACDAMIAVIAILGSTVVGFLTALVAVIMCCCCPCTRCVVLHCKVNSKNPSDSDDHSKLETTLNDSKA